MWGGSLVNERGQVVVGGEAQARTDWESVWGLGRSRLPVLVRNWMPLLEIVDLQGGRGKSGFPGKQNPPPAIPEGC